MDSNYNSEMLGSKVATEDKNELYILWIKYVKTLLFCK